MNRIEVATQAALDRVLHEQPEAMPVLVGGGWFELRGSAHVEASQYFAVHQHSHDRDGKPIGNAGR